MAKGGSRVGRGKGASAISDRSGFRFPMSEMVEEPGTGWLVHRSESDGMFSLVEHPANNLQRYLDGKFGDPYPVLNARPERSFAKAFNNDFNNDFDI